MSYNTAFPYFPSEDVEEMLPQFRDILTGKHMLTMGENVRNFESQFANYCGSKYAIATNSCSSALEISLLSLGLNHDDEVIVPAQTFIATGSCVLKVGANVVFCDTDDDFLLSLDDLKLKVTERTKAVIIVHFAGKISDSIFEIRDYLKERNIVLIEDAAHAHGAYKNEVKAGSLGDIGCFSFFSTKIMTTGEGGMITTNNEHLYKKMASIRNRGIDIDAGYEIFTNVGSNYRFTEMQAIMGIYQLKRLEEFIEHRNKIAQVYIQNLKPLENAGVIRFQIEKKLKSRHAYWRFICFLRENLDRKKVQYGLTGYGIKTDAPYNPLLHQQPVFKITEFQIENAAKLNNTHISIPVHCLISEDDANFISKKINEVINEFS